MFLTRLTKKYTCRYRYRYRILRTLLSKASPVEKNIANRKTYAIGKNVGLSAILVSVLHIINFVSPMDNYFMRCPGLYNEPLYSIAISIQIQNITDTVFLQKCKCRYCDMQCASKNNPPVKMKINYPHSYPPHLVLMQIIRCFLAN